MVSEDYKGNVSGLMGNFDGDKDNDFILPDGTILPKSEVENERKIYYNFGQKCKYVPKVKPISFTECIYRILIISLLEKWQFVSFRINECNEL